MVIPVKVVSLLCFQALLLYVLGVIYLFVVRHCTSLLCFVL
jgi:hypothetical protein